MSKGSTSPGRRGWLEGERGHLAWSPSVAPPAPSPLGATGGVKSARARASRPIHALDGTFAVLQDTAEPSAEHDAPQALFAPCVYQGTTRIDLPIVRGNMMTGDYSIPGWEEWIVFERKSRGDAIGTIFGTHEDSNGNAVANQDVFREELQRGAAINRNGGRFAIVIEAQPQDFFVYARVHRCRWDPANLCSIFSSFWPDYGIPVVWATSRAGAEHYIGAALARVWEQAKAGSVGAKKAQARGVADRLPWMAPRETGEIVEGAGDGRQV